jgi:mRNA interferase MazF
VWWVAFDPSIGGEIRKTRPAIIVSNDAANRGAQPPSGGASDNQCRPSLPVRGYVRVNRAQRKAMADQLSTISKLRLRERVGSLSPADIAAVERAICLQLGL